MITGKYPSLRLRRSRKNDWSRRLIQENNLTPNDFILPIFIIDGKKKRIPIKSMPGVYRYTLDRLNFVVDKSLSKTEVIQVAIFKYLILNEKLNKFGISGIIITTLGVILLYIKDVKLFFNNLFSKTTLIGLISGLFLALSVVYFRAAILTLDNISSDDVKAISALFIGLFIQTLILTIYLIFFEKSEFKKLYNDKYECLLTGIAGLLASLSWFYAFTLIQSSFVRAVGQVELLFSYFSSKYLFKEKVRFTEIVGIIIFVIGVSILLLSRN